MRNAIYGGIGVLFGIGILVAGLLGGGTQVGGAYGAGRVVGMIFGFVLAGVGLFYLITGIQAMNRVEQRPRPKRRKSRPQRVEDF